MKKQINFIFGVHNHQPIGNFDFVFEYALQKAYKPFFEMLLKHPDIKVMVHACWIGSRSTIPKCWI